jgi:serine/threonine protein kinase
VTSCQVCGAQNPEGFDVCRRCGDALRSPTVSISSKATPGDSGPTPTSADTHARGFAPGSMVAGRYRVVSLLGQGGMGEVYGADDLKLGQRVALKFLPIHRTTDNSWRNQFYAEVRIARQISHPNVCRVYDIGESDGRLFLSMEFVDGEDLASLLRRIGRLPDDKAVEVAQQLCAGLAAAHGAGVLHRDLKPSNVMLDGRGRARITDFGLAIAASDAGSGRPAGTPGYMAPELFAGAHPTVQSDLYALGLVLYEVFTGKRAFDAPNLAELHRKQSETNPTPPSNLVKNLDPAVERAIQRCLDREPSQRPRSAHAVAAALPGGDPLAAALAAGETPSPELVAAAGPDGSLRPVRAWLYFGLGLALILTTYSVFMPYATDWGLALMNKPPEVLADRAQDFAAKVGYSSALDHAYWFDREPDFMDYAAAHSKGKRLRLNGPPSSFPVSFFYRQSPTWMTPNTVWLSIYSAFPTLSLSPTDPPYETPGMVLVKLDSEGRLIIFRAGPQRSSTQTLEQSLNWNLFFEEAGLDQTQFSLAGPKWESPEPFDKRTDWEGHFSGRPDTLLHVVAASRNGRPVYFEVIMPWSGEWGSTPLEGTMTDRVVAGIFLLQLICYFFIGGFFAQRNLRHGRGDTKGAMRLAFFVALVLCFLTISNYHIVPRSDYLAVQFVFLGVPLFYSLLGWISYIAMEPHVRRYWPRVLVSWQRVLAGQWRDPLVGRDLLLGCLAGASLIALDGILSSFGGMSEAGTVVPSFGKGMLPTFAYSISQPAQHCILDLVLVAMLSFLSNILRKRWLGFLASGLVITVMVGGQGGSPLDFGMGALWAIVYFFVLTRAGLLGGLSFQVILSSFNDSPPLELNHWYAGRALIALMLPLGLLFYGFFVSLGGQPMLGSSLREE